MIFSLATHLATGVVCIAATILVCKKNPQWMVSTADELNKLIQNAQQKLNKK